MVKVPDGWFQMGCAPQDQLCFDDEKPAHRVWTAAFEIDRTEVSNGAYQGCVDAGECKPQPWNSCEVWTGGRWQLTSVLSDAFRATDHPAVCVDWRMAGAYCAWAGKRLPTEAEWEKAARGVDGRMWPWGNQAIDCKLANMADETGFGCGAMETDPVGSRPGNASPYGALDMVGNVWEWVADRWEDSYRRRGREVRSPTGPATGDSRVYRGGSFRGETPAARATVRGYETEDNANDAVGFRCAR